MSHIFISTDEKGYHVLPCGCKIGRLMSVYCGNPHTPQNLPPQEPNVIRRIELKMRARS